MSSLRVLTKGSPKPPAASPGTLRLYGMRYCPFVQRVWLVLTAKKLPFEMVNIHLLEKPEWYSEVSATGKVPCMEFDGKFLTESLVISDYLDDAYPENRLNPSDPYERARNRILLEQYSPLTSTVMPAYIGTLEDPGKWWEQYQKHVEFLERELVSRGAVPFFGGNKPGMLDYMAWPWLERLDSYVSSYSLKPFDSGRMPKLAAWMGRMAEDSVVKAIAFPMALHIQFLDLYRAGKVNYDLGL